MLFKGLNCTYKMKCQHCKSNFATQSSLNHHLKNAKYCLKIRNESVINFICQYCDKNISSRDWLKTHEEKCKENGGEERKKKKLEVENEELKSEVVCLLNEVEYLKHELETNKKESKEQIQDLQNKLENITLKSISRPTNTTNTTNNISVKIQAYMQDAQPITLEYLKKFVHNLTKKHIENGALGYVEYALQHPLKNNVKCSDYSRKKLHYKDGDNNIVTDHNMDKLTPMFFESIKATIIDIITNSDDVKNVNTDTFDKLVELADKMNNAKSASRGEKTEFSNEFSRRICSASVVS